MDYFNGLTNEDFVKFFIEELYSKTEFIQYSDPEEEFDHEQEYGKHIMQSQDKLFDFIGKSIEESGNISEHEKAKLYIEKKKELIQIILPKIDEYITTVNVDYR